MAKIKQDLKQLFRSNADNTSIYEVANSIGQIPSMTEDKFVEVVSNLLTERKSNQANSKNANCAIFDVSGSLPIEELEPIVRHAIFEAENPIEILQEDNEYDKRFIEALRNSGYDIVRQ